METIFESLVSKTLFIIATQILITFFASYWLIQVFHHKYLRSHPKVTALTNEQGEIDLDIPWAALQTPFYILLAVDMATFFTLLFYGTAHPTIGYGIFCLWSVLTGFELALVMLSIDENLGLRAMRLTALITFVAAMIGMYSGINFASLGGVLFICLAALILFDLGRLFFSFSNRTQLVGAIFGAVLFVFYLVFDFNRLETAGKYGWDNSWARAIDLSISIYLDIINLFLKILQILGHSKHH